MTLARKSALWIGIPFLIQSLIFALVLFLLHQSEHDEEQEYRSKTVIGRCNWVLSLCLSGNLDCLARALSQNQISLPVIQNPKAKLPEEFKALSSLFEPQDTRVKVTANLERDADKLFSVLDEIDKGVNGDRRALIDRLTVLQTTWKTFKNQREELLRQDRIAYAESRSAAPNYRQLLDKAAVTGVLLDLVLAIVLVYAFTHGIARRLKVLTDNTLLFASGRELRQPVKGDDELADFDQTFHDMASQISQARKTEKEALAAVVASESRVRSLIDNMPVGLVALNTDLAIQSANPAAQKLLGSNAERLAGTYFRQLFELELHEKKLFDATDGVIIPFRKAELSVKRSDGHLVPVEVSLTEFSNDQGAQVLVSLEDITERQELERLKREFLAMVSHDLRAPLTTIAGTLGLMSMGTFGAINERGLHLLRSSTQEAKRLTRLVQDLLDIAKIESGKFALEIRPIALSSIVETAIASVRSLADDKQTVIVDESDSVDAMWALVDSDRIVQVLVNLLTNALKFSPPESSIEISSKLLSNSRMIEVQVKDHGRGIPDSHLSAVFDRFRQVERSDATEKGGTGLGLAICKSIIEQHGGEIGVTSAVGEGATFWFHIPAWPTD